MEEPSSPVERACHDTPPLIHKTRRWIRNGWIAALVSAFFTLVFALAGATETQGRESDLWRLLDVFLMSIMAFGIYQCSRVAATAMFVYFLGSKVWHWVDVPNTQSGIGVVVGLVFVYFYFQAMKGTFLYHRLLQGVSTKNEAEERTAERTARNSWLHPRAFWIAGALTAVNEIRRVWVAGVSTEDLILVPMTAIFGGVLWGAVGTYIYKRFYKKP